MECTLLIGAAGHSWRDWLNHQSHRDLIVADLGNCDHGTPCRVSLWRAGKQIAWRFIGTLDVQRNPIAWLAAVSELVQQMQDGGIILCGDAGSNPVMRHLLLNLAMMVQPTEILTPEKTGLELWPWPVGAKAVPVSAGFPDLVHEAQRRALWLKLIEECSEHEVLFKDVRVIGSRLGSGAMLVNPDTNDYSEISGDVLHLVTQSKLGDEEIARMLDHTHTARLSMVDPRTYHGLICSFAHENGDDFGMGIVKRFDESRGLMTILNTALPPAPVRILKLGTFRIDSGGKEVGSLAPWTV